MGNSESVPLQQQQTPSGSSSSSNSAEAAMVSDPSTPPSVRAAAQHSTSTQSKFTNTSHESQPKRKFGAKLALNEDGTESKDQTTTTRTSSLAPVKINIKELNSEADCETLADKDMFNYTKLRDDLLAFSLGEAAYQYATRLNNETPGNPPVMALLAETAFLYEKTKNKGRREHWVDRLDVLQHGIDVARKCMHENPDYGPCYRAYVLCACKMSDNEVWFRRWKPLSLFKHYNRLQAIGDRALELYPSTDVALNLSSVSGRCATRIRHWYSPWQPLAWYNVLPYRSDLLLRAKDLLDEVIRVEPDNLEANMRLGEVLFEMGDLPTSRRQYVKVRDEMVAHNPDDAIWQSVAHTHLCSRHEDKKSWNLPFA